MDQHIHVHFLLEYAYQRYLQFSVEKNKKYMDYFLNQIHSMENSRHFCTLVPPQLLIMVRLVDSLKKFYALNRMENGALTTFRVSQYVEFLINDEDIMSEDVYDLQSILQTIGASQSLIIGLRTFEPRARMILDEVSRGFLSKVSPSIIFKVLEL
ncbi:hypothetical protein RF11_11632 [Thelohanellus kitauei]|uniref:Uncharacterized protein n=1 Tax=Thelohanellus kitauei TaxID=669202 RepID=A0A0C2J243_THEKT|nr:hypothetical protein RF11_11632 [Thelohanellus kitauei]